MSRPLHVDPHTRAKQATATNPAKSIWVSANAGSGKTYVLARRVIRLLLDGSKPSQLLCLTFTKAAAAEMSNRVFSTLGDWTMMDEGKLQEAIEELTGEKPTSKILVRARKLFALALDTPGGLRIQTIHAFCESLLQQFPLEANIPGHFVMADDLEQQALLAEAQRKVVLASEGHGTVWPDEHADSAKISEQLHRCYLVLREQASEMKIETAIRQLIHERDEFTGWLRKNGGNAHAAMKSTWEHFGFNRDDTLASLYASFVGSSNYNAASIAHLKELLEQKGGTKAQALLDLLRELSTQNEPQSNFDIRWRLHFTKKNETGKGFISSKFMLDNGLEDTYLREQALLLEQRNRLNTLNALIASEALFTVADAILTEYAALKQRRGLLDFSDLITKTVNLLHRSEISDWVQFKLDNGISHVLVDEAQDTSPEQWKVIEAITSEFYAGIGARDQIRTTFVVGDEKQSIFSFQGADPEEFNRQRRALKSKAENSKLSSEQVSLDLSFRSTHEVLSAVDQVFSLPENSTGLTGTGEKLSHTAARRNDPGEVIIWPLDLKPKTPERTDWREPPDGESATRAEILLANRIADTIKGWLDSSEQLPGRSEAIKPGDILILVRKRDCFVDAMNRALKTAGLDAAGADRLKLTTHIAIEDMIALGRFACMKLDDLALAGLLKSPLFALSEEEVYDLCIDRGKATLHQHLAELSATENPKGFGDQLHQKLQQVFKIIQWVLKQSAEQSVYGFYAGLFAQTGLREKYLARLGSEVEDVLDGFLQAAIDFDDKSGLGLQVFTETIWETEPELKREIDTESNQIRVITAHSSKGLEAPIVFLVDPGSRPFNTAHAPDVVTFRNKNEEEMRLWQPTKEARITQTQSAYETIEAAAEAEYRRLLYVGMTRSGDRLIICGYRQENEPGYLHWHKMIMNGLEAMPVDPKLNGRLESHIEGTYEKLHWVIDNSQTTKSEVERVPVEKKQETRGLPAWISRASQEPAPPRPLTPSGVLDLLEIGEPVRTTWNMDSRTALEQGNAVHHLIQVLPDYEPSERANAIEKYFALTSHTLSREEKARVSEMVLSVLEGPQSESLFIEGSRSEVEVTGSITVAGRDRMVRGKIDRLVVLEKEIIIADFKTNRIVPHNPSDVPTSYLAQMALYRSILSDLYRDKRVTCQLVWTNDGTVMTIPDALMDQQIQRITAHSQQDVSGGFLTADPSVPN